uniref:Reverse transcriptase domain-containing protein n=1 Tax=Tanacetum cinerariifolium TaxID=118510 RepID=A0A6L2MH16_TANCI|nr:reverse transcriptase domain-containing protein [Tanacetum cinerariifolium]
MYVDGHVDIFDMIDIDLFNVIALNMMVVQLDYGVTAVNFYQSEPTKESVCDFVTPKSLPQRDSSTPCKDLVCEFVTPRCMPHGMLTPFIDESVITYIQLSGVQGVDTQDHVVPTIQSQFSDINLSFVSQQATASQVIEDVMRQLSFEETELDGESWFGDVADSEDVGRTQVPVSNEAYFGRTHENIVEHVIVKDYVSNEEDVEQGNGQEAIEAPSDEQFFYDVKGIDNAYETQYYFESNEDVCTCDDDDDDDEEDGDFFLDEKNEIVEPDVDVHLFDISMDVPFDNIGVTNLVPDDVLEREDVDVINPDGFDSDPSNDNEKSNHRRRRSAELSREIKGVMNSSSQWNVKVRARCDGKVSVFIMSQGTGPTGPNQGIEARVSGSSGPSTRSKKRKNTCTNDDDQGCSSALDAHDKGDLYPWVLYVRKDKHKKIDEISVKAVQDHLQRDFKFQVSMSKAFRAKVKAERGIREDQVL